MKITAPESADQYFQQTEHAVKHAYAGLASCWQHVEKAHEDMLPPIEKDGMLVWEPPVTAEETAKLERSLASYKKYFELQISEAMFAGSVLEAAYIAIRIYSPKKPIPPSCAAFALPRSAGHFCIGKQCHGIPAGLIVYAGRNQYAHWDDTKPHKATKAIFAALDDAFMDNPFCDLAFDLGNPTINIYAGEVLHTALGWKSYDTYLTEMKQLLP